MPRACRWMREQEAIRITNRAYLQATREFGIGPHIGGKCPTPDCRCEELADQIVDRIEQLIEEETGLKLPEE